VPGGRPALVRRRPRANLSDHRYPRGDSAPQGDRAPQGRRAPNGHRAPTGHRAPNNHHVPERLRTPSGHSANPTVATPADLLNSRPALPVIPVLLGLGAAGLAAMALSYSRARRHRAIITDSPQADPASPAKAAPRVRPMPRQGQVARVPEVHPPRREVRPVPLARVAGSVLTRGRRERSPALPVASALVATAGLGLGLRRLVRRSRQRRTEQRRTQARDTRTLRAVLSAVGGGVKQTGGRR
jgi:hypothetical protein